VRGIIRSIEFMAALIILTAAVAYVTFFVPPYTPPEEMAESARSIADALASSGILDEILRSAYDPYYSWQSATRNATQALTQVMRTYGNPAYAYRVSVYQVTPGGFRATVYTYSGNPPQTLPPGPGYTLLGEADVGGLDIRVASGQMPSWLATLGAKPGNPLVVVFRGYVVLNETGGWTFMLYATGGGAALLLNGSTVADIWSSGGFGSSQLQLGRGIYEVLVYWRLTSSAGALQLSCKSPSGKQYIPISVNNILSGGATLVLQATSGKAPSRPEVVVDQLIPVFTRGGFRAFLIRVEAGR